MLSKKFLISMQREKFELYCHKHKHKTKILGYPMCCSKCMEEDFRKNLNNCMDELTPKDE